MVIDLRSDTVTRPTAEMRAAMAAAEVGDDVYGEDPTVVRLEAMAAEMLGTEAAIFATSGTQSNLLGLLTHCQRGDEYIVGQEGHTYKYEGGGAAVFGSIQPQPLDYETDGTLNLYKVEKAIKPDDFHCARTRLLCLENTQAGKVLPLDYLRQAAKFAQMHKIKLHLDGARIFNAAVKQKIDVKEISCHFDSISICLSKGLGAPVGSLLCAGKGQVKEARRWRKVLGGGMRQAGVLAAPGIIALKNHVQRLQEDHENASRLAQGLSDVEEISLDLSSVQTNMVFFSIEDKKRQHLQTYLKERGILIGGRDMVRLVTHRDISEKNIQTVIAEMKNFFSSHNR